MLGLTLGVWAEFWFPRYQAPLGSAIHSNRKGSNE